jgi:sugar phosphate isomerase/epimerase
MTAASELVLYAGCLPATPFAELVAAAASAGFDAISVWPLVYRRAISREGLDPPTMGAMVRDAGLRVTDVDACGDWLPAPEVADDLPPMFRSIWTRHQFFDAATALGADTVVAAHLTGGAVTVAQAIDGFAALCDDAAERGLRVALEFMPFSAIGDLATGWSIVRQADRPNGGLVLDVCHLARGGWDADGLRAVPPDRVFSVQLGDGPQAAPVDLRDEAMFHRALPGHGELGVAGFLAVLDEMGVRTRIGPELYQRGWSERPAAVVAADLAAATRAALDHAPAETPAD